MKVTTYASPNGALKNGTAAAMLPLSTNSACLPEGTKGMHMQLNAANPTLCLQQQTGPVSLAPGQKAIIYFKIPQNLLTTVDAGSASSVALYAGKVGSPVSVTVAAK